MRSIDQNSCYQYNPRPYEPLGQVSTIHLTKDARNLAGRHIAQPALFIVWGV